MGRLAQVAAMAMSMYGMATAKSACTRYTDPQCIISDDTHDVLKSTFDSSNFLQSF